MNPNAEILKSLTKYGATAFFCLVFYFDFVRPLGKAQQDHLERSLIIQRENTDILKENTAVLKVISDNQSRYADISEQRLKISKQLKTAVEKQGSSRLIPEADE